MSIKPYLKYAGRKFDYPAPLSKIFDQFRSTHTWVEPFNGANGATFEVLPTHALLNDSNPFINNLHQWVKDGGIPQDTSFFINEEEVYYQNRIRFNELASKYPTWEAIKSATPEVREELALLFYYLNRTGYNGLCRFNRKGKFNVPYNGFCRPNRKGEFNVPFGDNNPDWIRNFSPWSQVMAKWSYFTMCWKDFLSYVDFLGVNACIYSDPPYDGGKTAFVGYAGSKFDWDDQVELCVTLFHSSHPVIASNLATDRILGMYRDIGFQVWTFPVRRTISCKGSKRKPVIENSAWSAGVPLP
jgi:DNA adenine methylase